jgi:hypothetical protein
VEVYRESDDPAVNLAHHRLVRARADALVATGDSEAATAELGRLREDLAARGVNEVVLDSIQEATEELEGA